MNEVECVAVDELPGKTISHFHFGGGGGSIGLRFTDGTVIQFDCRVSGGLGFVEREPFLYPEDFSIAALDEMFGQKMASYIDGRKKQLQDANGAMAQCQRGSRERAVRAVESSI